MSKYQPYYERFKRKSCVKAKVLTVCIALFLLIGIFGLSSNIHPKSLQSKPPSPAIIADDKTSSVPKQQAAIHPPIQLLKQSKQNHLTDSDKITYKKIFNAQKTANWELADKSISTLSNDILLGNVLAERYLHRDYDTSSEEISNWLRLYPDHQQANDIIELASNKYPKLVANLPKSKEHERLSGYGDTNTNDIRFNNNPQAEKLWLNGLEAWRTGDKSSAAKIFSELADKQKDLSDWQYSAANFWAYRAYLALGKKELANKYLSEASNNSRVFYGILARKQLNKPLELDTKTIKPNADDIAKLKEKPSVKRIIALAESGLNGRAETKIRSLFPSASKQEKWALLSLASQLNLASAQISMAKQLETNEQPLDKLKYPVPMWKPLDGFNVDPSLLYALMRQESGFHQSAISSGGALGLMQLMPKTALKMKNSGIDTLKSMEKFSEPVLNITLGERYVEHLLNSKNVKNNLFYMLAAYNAGPGRLQKWKNSITYNDDPLLFVESIPYTETRCYVMQVMTNYWIYSELVGASNKSILSLLQGDWPNYSPLSEPIADSGQSGNNG
ncbi:MAG: transglycosylase SLT domain-containing protein [Rickettsiales bacterium]